MERKEEIILATLELASENGLKCLICWQTRLNKYKLKIAISSLRSSCRSHAVVNAI